jgi:hypothetical protein
MNPAVRLGNNFGRWEDRHSPARIALDVRQVAFKAT